MRTFVQAFGVPDQHQWERAEEVSSEQVRICPLWQLRGLREFRLRFVLRKSTDTARQVRTFIITMVGKDDEAFVLTTKAPAKTDAGNARTVVFVKDAFHVFFNYCGSVVGERQQ